VQVLVPELVSDLAAVKTAVVGFTNMAQGFVLADSLLTRWSKDAHSAAMTISVGRSSFKFCGDQESRRTREEGHHEVQGDYPRIFMH
jgi:hypothetical protein